MPTPPPTGAPDAAEDKRSEARLPLVLQVEYPEREGYLADATENLSAGGAFVRTDRVLAIGDRVAMTVSFPGLLAPVDLVGVVAWVRPAREGAPAGVGLKLPEDRKDDREKLAALLARMKEEKAAAVARGFRILLVEDNPHIMELYEYVMKKLSRTGGVKIEVAVAKDGHDALARLETDRYDLVVTDLYMPVMDGFEFIRKVRAAEALKAIPIIAISAGGTDARQLAQSVGANVYLRKPVRFVDVVETVKALLRL